MAPARQLDLAIRPKPAARGRTRGVTRLAIVLGDGNTPPTEFRLFVKGWNDTENGRFLFDDVAAESVMAAYAKWGVDVAIDLEHQMLESGIAPDPTAKDARGWCRLELRADGSLWAVAVTWTPDGAARLTDKRQRYVSPAFGVDPETSRVTQIVNVAITSIPATHDTPALVAASATGAAMDPDQVKAALDAITAGDDAKCADILKGLIASAASGEAATDPNEPAELAAEDATDEDKTEKSSDMPAPAEPGATDEKKNKEMMAAARMALALTGMSSPGEAMAELSRRSKVAVDLKAREAKLEADRATLEAGERRTLVGSLVKLGVEIPATAWSDDKGAVPCARLLSEPIEDLRKRVATLSAAGGAVRRQPKAPVSGAGGAVDLTQEEIAMCARKKVDPAVYAQTKAAIAARSNAPRAQEG